MIPIKFVNKSVTVWKISIFKKSWQPVLPNLYSLIQEGRLCLIWVKCLPLSQTCSGLLDLVSHLFLWSSGHYQKHVGCPPLWRPLAWIGHCFSCCSCFLARAPAFVLTLFPLLSIVPSLEVSRWLPERIWHTFPEFLLWARHRERTNFCPPKAFIPGGRQE